MLRAFKYKLDPTADQTVQLSGMVGATRFIYNLALETKIAAYTKGVSVGCFDETTD